MVSKICHQSMHRNDLVAPTATAFLNTVWQRRLHLRPIWNRILGLHQRNVPTIQPCGPCGWGATKQLSPGRSPARESHQQTHPQHRSCQQSSREAPSGNLLMASWLSLCYGCSCFLCFRKQWCPVKTWKITIHILFTLHLQISKCVHSFWLVSKTSQNESMCIISH